MFSFSLVDNSTVFFNVAALLSVLDLVFIEL